jgi:hypothetical protein
MCRKLFTGVICLILFGAFCVPNGRADESDKKTIVTLNGPIEVPGKVLPAGTYVFKLLNPNDLTLVAVYSADETQLITMVRGIADYRMEVPDKPIFLLEERSSGQPQALEAWFYQGDDSGVEFVYAKPKATEVADLHRLGLASKPEEPASQPEPAAAISAPVVTTQPASVQELQPTAPGF